MANEVNITITADDLTGAAFASALAKMKLFQKTAEDTARKLSDVGGAKVSASLNSLGRSADNAGGGFRGLGFWAGGAWGWLGRINRQIPLFAGALKGIPFVSTIGGLHLIGESILEAAAVLIPASAAFIAFGAASIGTVMDISRSMKSLWITTHALNMSIYPLTGSMQKLEEAVAPKVWSLFGDILIIANAKTAVFTRTAKEAGTVLQQLGARMTVALTSGGLDQFMRNAAKDLAGIGSVIGNIFGIIGNVLHAVPGYAETLLSALNGLTHGLELITGSPIGQWALKLGLAFHGAVIWLGIGATAAVWLGNALVGLAAKFGLVDAEMLAFDAAAFGAGIKQMLGGVGLLIGEMFTLGTAEGLATDAALALDGAMAAAGAVNPLVWVGAAAVALGALVFWLVKSSSAISSYSTAANAALKNQPVTQLGVNLTKQMSIAQTQLNNTQKNFTVTSMRTGQQVTQTTDAYKLQRNEVGILKTYWSNYSAVLKAAGGNIGLVNEAGITSKDILEADAQKLKELKIEAQAAADAQRALGLGIGRAAAAQNAQNNIFMQETVPAMQKVITEEDNLLNVVIGGQIAFNNFQQSIEGTTAKFKSPSGLIEASKLAKGDLSGLNEQSLAFSNTLYSISIPALQKTTDALELQGISTKDLTKVVATGSGEILKYVGHNREARSVMVSYINNALGPGTVSLQNLDKWVKNNSTSIAGMNSIVGKATVNAGNMTNTLKGMTTQLFQQDLLLSNHVNRDMKRWTDLIASSGENTNRTRSARTQLIRDLENTGMSAKDATSFVNGLQRKIDAMHGKSVTVKVFASGGGGMTFTQKVAQSNSSGGFSLHSLARGGKLPGFGGGDKHPALLESGETVVSKEHSKKKFMVAAFKAAGVPGYASGGISGMVPWVGDQEASFARLEEQNFLKVEIANLNNALKKQAQSQATKQAGLGNLPLGKGPHSGSAAIAQAFAKSILWAYGWGMGQWPYEQALWNQESGWNAYAVNPSSGAYGIPQSLGHGHPYDLGDYKAQIRWGDAYISQRYGNPQNAWAHERAFNWYDNGGWLNPGANFMWNGTGQREHLSRDNAGRQNIVVTLSFDDTFQQATGLTPAQLRNLKYTVRILGGGDVQKALGK
jgi:hypothetical protein